MIRGNLKHMTTEHQSNWAEEAAIEVHNNHVSKFENWYSSSDPLRSAFRYGRHMIEPYFQKELNLLASDKKILDVGCGTGEQARVLLSQGRDVFGIEPAPNMLTVSAQGLEARVQQGVVGDLPFPDEHFDFVYALEVFRYLSSAENIRGMSEIWRVLKPGGTFFATYVNLYALDLFYLWTKARTLTGSVENHTEFETPSTLYQRLHHGGFGQIEIHGAMFAPLRLVYKLNESLGRFVGKLISPVDSALSDLPILRPFAGHLIAIARK